MGKGTTIIVTGSGGLIGSEASRYFAAEGYDIVGIDNDMRAQFFGPEASTRWSVKRLQDEVPNFESKAIDIREKSDLERIFEERKGSVTAVIHTAAQPSHDWAARDPITDFEVNARGTLNLLECLRHQAPEAAFVFTSTNKVYGDRPNTLPMVEDETRYEVYLEDGSLHPGVDESMSVDQTQHSLFGVSKLSADVLVQEYGRYFGLNTVAFRGGCLTGGGHSGTELHGFISYLMKCTLLGTKYRVFGYQGKQVRDNIHSSDLVSSFHEFIKSPLQGRVYNIGGGRFANCSLNEAVKSCEQRVGKNLEIEFLETPRRGDHQWYVSDCRRFQADYPNWRQRFDMERIYDDVYEELKQRELH